MKKCLLLLGFISVSIFGFTQEEDSDGGRFFFGGNFGLSFGDLTLINISPQLGYRFSNFLAAGAGINGQYVSLKSRYSNGDPYSKSSRGVAGLNIFGRIYPLQQIMLQVQPEANYIFGKEILYGNPNQEYKLDPSIVPSFLIGAGAVMPAGRGSFIASLFYDVLQDPKAPYGTRPFVNFSYNIGIR